MKTLATCKPTEFLTQTNKIRKHVEKWLKNTRILELRKSLPELKKIPDNATAEERADIIEENKKALKEQSSRNLSKMLDAALDEHPEETFEVLALCCFVEPENMDDYSVEEYLNAIADLIGNSAVINFFTSLVQLGQILTSDAPNQ